MNLTVGEFFANEALFKYTLYGIMGSILLVTNSLIVGAIVRHEVLRRRKEYIIVAGLAVADQLAGLATFVSALYRIYVILIGEADVLISRWQCALHPHLVLFVVAQPLQAVMLFVISVDRLVAVAVPRTYYQLGTRYGLAIVGAAYTPSLLLSLVGLARLHGRDVLDVKRTCVTSGTIDYHFNYVYNYFRTGFSTASVVLYVFVFALFRRSHRSVGAATETTASAFKRKQQRRLTITLGITCLFTLFFYVMPIGLTGYLRSLGANMTLISPWLWLIVCVNAALNIFVYTGRHADMRAGISYLLRCKELPPNFADTAKSRAK